MHLLIAVFCPLLLPLISFLLKTNTPSTFMSLFFFLGTQWVSLWWLKGAGVPWNPFLLRTPLLWVRANPSNLSITSLCLTWPHHRVTVRSTGVRGWIFHVSNCATYESNSTFSLCSPEPRIEGRFVTSLSSIHRVRDGYVTHQGAWRSFLYS